MKIKQMDDLELRDRILNMTVEERERLKINKFIKKEKLTLIDLKNNFKNS